MSRTLFLSIIFIFLFQMLSSQDVVKVVTLESVDIQAVEDDFDTEAFIEKVKADTSFYMSFKALNFYPAKYRSWLKVFKRGEDEKGNVTRYAERFREEDLMWVEIIEEEVRGKIKKKGEYKYMTAEAWDEIFFPVTKQKVSMSMARDFEKERGLSSMERHRLEVKQMMFNPGIAVDGVPFVGKKMGVFDEDMIEYYDYSVYTSHYKDSIRCLVFDISAKPEFRDGKTVIKSLLTYFDQETFEVMQREINIQYYSLPLDFDIYIKVQNQKVKGILIPETIYYKGFFDLPFMKKEELEFLLYDFDYLF